MYVPPTILIRVEVSCAFKRQVRLVGFGQVRRTADQSGNILGESVQGFAGRFASCDTLAIGREAWQILVPAIGQLPAPHAVQLIGKLRKLSLVVFEFCFPRRARLRAALPYAVFELIVNAFGHEQLGVYRPAAVLLAQLDFRLTSRLTMRSIRSL